MLCAALCNLVAFILRISPCALQAPLDLSHHWRDDTQAIPGGLSDQWNLDNIPNPDDTDHLVFETAHSLLQRWPNTRYKNGHNIVPGVIPKGTILYHVNNHSAEIPPGLEWAGTNPEHSYVYCIDEPVNPQVACWLSTFAATRPLRVIYFDGLSAMEQYSGPTDAQQIFIWGKVRNDLPSFELPMVQDMCAWGKKFGVDGFVRMEFDFEVLICDFTSGLSLVSNVKLENRGPWDYPGPGYVTFEAVDAGTWHDRFPGETRIQLDLSSLVSLYDTQLVPSLIPTRVGQDRWYHRVENTSREDVRAIRSRVEAAFSKPRNPSSKIDWKTLIQVIVNRFAGRLELTRHLLNSSATDSDDILDLANITQTQLRVMLTPYILFSTAPTDPSDKNELEWTIPIYKLCATTHTSSMDSELKSMTESEKLLLRAVRGTTQEICRVVTRMWAAGVYAGLDQWLNTNASPDTGEVMDVWKTWRTDLDGLMTWLDWSVWNKCNPGCGPEELCLLPTKQAGFKKQEVNDDGVASQVITDTMKLTQDELGPPQPRCVSRLVPQVKHHRKV